MTAKRLSDLCLVVVLTPPAIVLLAILSLVVAFTHGRPFFYLGERVRSPGNTFRIIKLRTMETCPEGKQRVLGGDMSNRITPLGLWLRRTRLDELPQLWNVLRGDLSFVGPRPPLQSIVDAAPKAYSEILRNVPGITGLATVMVCSREERILSKCRSDAETEAVYLRRCLPVKLRIEQLYAQNRSLALDAYVLYLTAARVVRLPGRRAGRVWRLARRPVRNRAPATPLYAKPSAFEAPDRDLLVSAQLSRNARLK